MRPCLTCNRPTNGTRCERCERRRRARLYGPQHRDERATWAALVNTGTITCPRCHEPIEPNTPWDLGHRPDHTRHPEHATCNRQAGATHTP